MATISEQLQRAAINIETIMANQSGIRDDQKSLASALHTLAIRVAEVNVQLESLTGSHHDLKHKMFDGNGQPAVIPEIKTRLALVEDRMIPRDELQEMMDASVNTGLKGYVHPCTLKAELPTLVTKIQMDNEAAVALRADGRMDDRRRLRGKLATAATFIVTVKPALWPLVTGVVIIVCVMSFSPYVGPGLAKLIVSLGGKCP